MKGKVSAYSGPIQHIFSPMHVSLSFTARSDIKEDVIRDKVRHWQVLIVSITWVERSGSGVELQTLDYEDPGSNPVLQF